MQWIEWVRKITLRLGMCCVKSFFKLSCIEFVCHDPFKSKITIISSYCCNDLWVTCNFIPALNNFYSFFLSIGVLAGCWKRKNSPKFHGFYYNVIWGTSLLLDNRCICLSEWVSEMSPQECTEHNKTENSDFMIQ